MVERAERITVSFPKDLLERVDQARGPVPRSRWLAEAAERRLSEDRATFKLAVGEGGE